MLKGQETPDREGVSFSTRARAAASPEWGASSPLLTFDVLSPLDLSHAQSQLAVRVQAHSPFLPAIERHAHKERGVEGKGKK